MKLPNFRLYETQATTALLVGVLCLISLIGLSLVVFHNYDHSSGTIAYNDQAGVGQYRNTMVMAGTAVTVGLGLLAGALGFSSLGQKRNTKNSRSALGLICGAVAIALSPVLFVAWRKMAEAIIQKAT